MSFETAITPLLDCMCTALAQQGWEGQCCINPGQPVFDSCCPDTGGGGTAWARLVNAYPSNAFPRRDVENAVTDCGGAQQWALVVDLGAVRCVCEDLCDCSIKAANAALVLGDAEAAIQGVNCCFSQGRCGTGEYRINQLTIVGPDGGCGGFRLEVVVAYLLACCPQES
jgi:hypothetical protein